MGAQGEKPVPLPDDWSRPYWEAAKDHRLVVQRCTACGHAQYPPDVVCHQCQGDAFSYDEVSGKGTVWSFATFRRSLMPVFDAPYVLTLVELDDVDVRMMTNLVEVDPDDATIGMAVEVTFEDRGEWSIPQFRPVQGAAT